jgi:beta-galactosidase
MGKRDSYPFLWGAQYYRAPTPEQDCWEQDLRRMRELGCNCVKFWVQWRWSHRTEDRFYFDDLDLLMDLAAANNLKVHLNTIFDVAPIWLYEKYPDALQLANSGLPIQPQTTACRQIGGAPGPCYTHPGALQLRQAFMTETVKHFAGQGAMDMWDVWNEPEQCMLYRLPELATLTCYCDSCKTSFAHWLQTKYGDLEGLNEVWGRCYDAWEQVELPRSPATFGDFIDWREFHLDVMTSEADWRLRTVEKHAPENQIAYLHVVPNTMQPFNSVTCVDDFAFADTCHDGVFGATTLKGAVFPIQHVSAAGDRIAYNVEDHINGGNTGLHPKRIGLEDLLRDLLPQIGVGIKGFMFWQFRPEVLGVESPAWGMVGLDGADKPMIRAAQTFWHTIGPQVELLMACSPTPARVGIWKSRKNEIFHFACQDTLDPLRENVEAYTKALYDLSVPYRYVSGKHLEAGAPDGLRLLIMPSCYCLTPEEAEGLDTWVRGGGTLVCEAHLGGYNAATNRHSRVLPGCGLAEKWGLREVETLSSHHLGLGSAGGYSGEANDDVRKALSAYGTSGGQFFPIRLVDGEILTGAEKYAVLEGSDWTPVGEALPGEDCIMHRRLGAGAVWYAGTLLGTGCEKTPSNLTAFLTRHVFNEAGVAPRLNLRQEHPGDVHVEVLLGESGAPAYLVVENTTAVPRHVSMDLAGRWHGMFSGHDLVIAADRAEIPGGLIDIFCQI